MRCCDHFALRTWTPVVVIFFTLAGAVTAGPPHPPVDESEHYVAPVYTDASDYDETYTTVAPDYQYTGADDSCAEDCGCFEHDGCCTPWLTIRAEAIIWDRVDNSTVPLVSSPVNLASDDFDFDWRAGPRIGITGHNIFHTCWDAEVIYAGIDSWQSQLTLVDINNYLTTPQINIGGATPGTLLYSSELDSFEVNLRRGYSDWLTWLVGFRTLEIDETLLADFGGVASNSVDASNRLYGGQFGLDAVLFDYGGPFFGDVIGKAGVYGNNADVRTISEDVGGAVPLIAAEGGETCFAGEITLRTGYRLTERLHVIGGYNLLWITDLALAPEQLAVTNIATGQATVDVSSTLFYHGANVGLQYLW